VAWVPPWHGSKEAIPNGYFHFGEEESSLLSSSPDFKTTMGDVVASAAEVVESVRYGRMWTSPWFTYGIGDRLVLW
jgi:hypothetical protein